MNFKCSSYVRKQFEYYNRQHLRRVQFTSEGIVYQILYFKKFSIYTLIYISNLNLKSNDKTLGISVSFVLSISIFGFMLNINVDQIYFLTQSLSGFTKTMFGFYIVPTCIVCSLVRYTKRFHLRVARWPIQKPNCPNLALFEVRNAKAHLSP